MLACTVQYNNPASSITFEGRISATGPSLHSLMTNVCTASLKTQPKVL